MRTAHLLAPLVLLACGGQEKAAGSPSQCSGERPAASLAGSDRFGPALAGGANAWVELRATRAEAQASDNHLFIDGREVSVASVTAPGADAPLDATGGRLTVREGAKRSAGDDPHLVGFRVPAGLAPGKHELTFKTCDVAAAETLALEVLSSPAPSITSVRHVHGEWPVIFIKGVNLADAEEVILVGRDGAVTRIPNITKVDDGQLRAPLDHGGTYDVFVRSKGGVGGGPPSGLVTVR